MHRLLRQCHPDLQERRRDSAYDNGRDLRQAGRSVSMLEKAANGLVRGYL